MPTGTVIARLGNDPLILAKTVRCRPRCAFRDFGLPARRSLWIPDGSGRPVLAQFGLGGAQAFCSPGISTARGPFRWMTRGWIGHRAWGICIIQTFTGQASTDGIGRTLEGYGLSVHRQLAGGKQPAYECYCRYQCWEARSHTAYLHRRCELRKHVLEYLLRRR